MATTRLTGKLHSRLDKCRGARRAGARFTTLVQIRPKKTEPALTALSMLQNEAVDVAFSVDIKHQF